MFLYYLINIWKTKQSWLKKTLSRLAWLAHLREFIWKIFISPRRDLDRIKWDITQAGWLASHMNTLYFYKNFLRKVRSQLDELVRLTGPAHLHMNNPSKEQTNYAFYRLLQSCLSLIWHFLLLYSPQIRECFYSSIKICFRNILYSAIILY